MGLFSGFRKTPAEKAKRNLYREAQRCTRLANQDRLKLADVSRLCKLVDDARSLELGAAELEGVVVEAAKAVGLTSFGRGLMSGAILRIRGVPLPAGADQASEQMRLARSVAVQCFGEDQPDRS